MRNLGTEVKRETGGSISETSNMYCLLKFTNLLVNSLSLTLLQQSLVKIGIKKLFYK